MRPAVASALWMLPGVILMLAAILIGIHLQGRAGPGEELAFRTKRAELVGRMQLGLASAAEAEKSAVLSGTDTGSKAFADEARAAAADVGSALRALDELLKARGTQRERDLLVEFAVAFAEYQRVDGELLSLASKNTNVKAYALAFGPAADAVSELSAALNRLVAANASSKDVSKIMPLAFGAQASALRIQTLLAPHIAEASDAKMDALEARMAKDDTEVHADLEALAAFPEVKSRPDLANAVASFTTYASLRTEILALSRENTNVRSLSISLDQKRKVTDQCEAALTALKQAFVDESFHPR